MTELNRRLRQVEKALQTRDDMTPHFINADGKTEAEIEKMAEEIYSKNPKAIVFIDDIPKGE